MAASTVLRIRRTDGNDGEFVVARIEQSTIRRLDLVLTASDGFEVFSIKVKQAELDSLRNTTSRTTLDDWHTVLYAKLLRDEKSLADEAARDVDLVATLDGSLTITLRKTIGRITQRLGDIRLPADLSAEADFPQWAAEAASEADVLLTRAMSLQLQLDEQTRLVEELRKQVNNGVREREGHQDELLQKFAAVLNTKKMKIRDQQRQLTKAGVDSKDEEKSPHLANGNKNIKNRKRKAEVERDVDNIGEEHDESVTRHGDESDATQRTETPDLESEAEMEVLQKQISPPVTRSQDTSEQMSQQSTRTNVNKEAPKEHGRIPPRRELPFAKSKGNESEAKSQASFTANAEGVEEDEETDDEL